MTDIKEYFNELDEKAKLAYDSAQKAREKGYDPELRVDIPLAKGMSERVEALVSAAWPQLLGSGVAQRLVELEKQFSALDWRVALTISAEVAEGKFCKFPSKKEAIEIGIRVGLAYITLGVIAAPLEGFIDITIKKTRDGKEYLAANYAGPIRAAGGTAAAVSVIIADYVRMKQGLAVFDPDEKEQKRHITEIQDYHERCSNLQYFPSEQELAFLISHIPIQIDGDPTETIEVSKYKDLPRIATNRVRGGMCLVLAEGIAQKAPKVFKNLDKWGKSFGLDQWMWMKEFLDLQKMIKAKVSSTKTDDNKPKPKILPNYTFIKDLVAGRPVLTYPLAHGGFRLRYGRSRTSGFAAQSIHPATMQVLFNYIATGTQLKLERPGKATVLSPCDTIEGPIVKLNNGDVILFENPAEAKKIRNEIAEIIYLGDLLINYGDFSVNNHSLVPVGYNEEWYLAEIERAVKQKHPAITTESLALLLAQDTNISKEKLELLLKIPNLKLSFAECLALSKSLQIPLHPKFTYHWNAITIEQFWNLFNWLPKAKVEYNDLQLDKIIIPKNPDIKRSLELIGVPHIYPQQENIVIEKEHAQSFFFSLGGFSSNLQNNPYNSVLEIVNAMSPVPIKDKSGTFIGARMGRPEKAKQRKLIGSPHVLFPVGDEGGRMRSVQAAIDLGKVKAQFPLLYCESCKTNTVYLKCHKCNNETKQKYFCKECGFLDKKCYHDPATFTYIDVPLQEYVQDALKKTSLPIIPEGVRGVRGTSNKNHVPEHLVKGFLRSRHNICVNKDGTTRYDMIQMPITHFKPKEVRTSVEKLISLGYDKDMNGNQLIKEDQILELKPQDIILPCCSESNDEPADVVVFRIAQFIDELLVNLYKLPPYYNLKSKEDIVGHLLIALAPHTSAGIIVRTIGFSKTQAMYCHPMLHAATRRNCDGDEAGIILLMDGLLNFSRSYLPDKRGSRTMDAPLVLTAHLIPSEIDDEVHGMDIVWKYPIELYELSSQYKSTNDVKILQLKDVLNTPKEYTGFGFTHDTNDLNDGVRCSAYKLIPSMEDKLKGQMLIAEKIRAVNATDVAAQVIEKHFLKDTKGNLRKFFQQQFRCSKCNNIYRRPPLLGRCFKCGGPLIFTIAEGSIVKYLEPSISLANKYNVSPYLKQTLVLLKDQIEGVFGKEKEKQEGLGKWFG